MDKTPVDNEQLKELEGKTVPLAYHEMCMTRNAKTLRHIVIGWAASIVAVVLIFAYMWMSYDYVSTTEYAGVYNVTDSEGNVVSSDLSPEEIIEIVKELNRGNNTENTNSET